MTPALKLLLAPAFMVATSLVARRWGVRVAGAVAGLPAIGGPILLVVDLEHGRRFAHGAAVGTMLGFVLAVAVRPLGTAPAFLLALAAALGAQACLMAVLVRRERAPLLAPSPGGLLRRRLRVLR